MRKMATRQFTNRPLLTKIIRVTAFSNRLIQFFFSWKENSMDYLMLKFQENRSTNQTVGVIQSCVPFFFLPWLCSLSLCHGLCSSQCRITKIAGFSWTIWCECKRTPLCFRFHSLFTKFMSRLQL